MKKKPLITIFTPTYNRAYIIPKLYESLKNQTNQNFEWLIVDDGSSDATEALIKSFIEENSIPIVYLKKNNEGKHVAINKGVENAKGELFFIVDSDDYLTENATQLLENYYSRIENDEKLAGVSFRRGYNINKSIGKTKNFNDFISDIFEFRYKMKIKGDMAEVYKTKVLKKFPFPLFYGEKFCAESLIWNRIGTEYKLLWTSSIVYICNYLEDGLSSKSIKLRRQSYKTSMLFYSELEKFQIPLSEKLKANINYWRFSFCSNEKIKTKLLKVNKINSLIGFPLGFLMNQIDELKS